MNGVSYREHKTNECVWQQVNILAGRQEPLLSGTKCRKLSWFGHVYQGTVDSSRRRGRPRKSWRDNVEEWTRHSRSSLLRITDDRSQKATITVEASVGIPQQRPGVMGN